MTVATAAPLAVTAGEPAGIGPDLCVMLAQQPLASALVVIADRGLLQQRAHLLGVAFDAPEFVVGEPARAAAARLSVLHVPLARTAVAGTLDRANSRYVLATLDHAIDGCLNGTFAAMVTGPVHKGIINEAGIDFTGHTEYLAAKTGCQRVVMMLAGGGLRVALATTHLALKDVPASITRDSLEQTLVIVEHDLRTRFGIERPRILVAGMNPHAGESGHFGREEIDVIVPVLERLRARGFQLDGPLPADTLFTPQRLQHCDCVLAMYHDQGLPVLKYASFGSGINVTLGLPIIRTSVDHGTALDLAGSGRAAIGSMLQALTIADELARRGP
jgi:4-hydroxythreonine-4-phosphate dehydrogenase